ncbi:hypothetical protein, conserved in T. vivax, (fragment), partial [Trypanosoma vivax Y486]
MWPLACGEFLVCLLRRGCRLRASPRHQRIKISCACVAQKFGCVAALSLFPLCAGCVDGLRQVRVHCGQRAALPQRGCLVDCQCRACCAPFPRVLWQFDEKAEHDVFFADAPKSSPARGGTRCSQQRACCSTLDLLAYSFRGIACDLSSGFLNADGFTDVPEVSCYLVRCRFPWLSVRLFFPHACSRSSLMVPLRATVVVGPLVVQVSTLCAPSKHDFPSLFVPFVISASKVCRKLSSSPSAWLASLLALFAFCTASSSSFLARFPASTKSASVFTFPPACVVFTPSSASFAVACLAETRCAISAANVLMLSAWSAAAPSSRCSLHSAVASPAARPCGAFASASVPASRSNASAAAASPLPEFVIFPPQICHKSAEAVPMPCSPSLHTNVAASLARAA